MSSGSILRGHLRPVGARGPPFLIILLLVIIVILGFNYWNLSSEYDTILKETADLQDHLRLALLKKETADRQYEAFEKRYRESEAQLGKLKLAADQKEHEISKASEKLDMKSEENKKIKSELISCQAIKAKLEMNSGMIDELQKKTSQLEEQKNSLSQENKKMLKTINGLRYKIEEMEFHQSNSRLIQQAPNPVLLRSKSLNGSYSQDEVTKVVATTTQNIKMDVNKNATISENKHVLDPEVNKVEGESVDQQPSENKIPVAYSETETLLEAPEGQEKLENNAVESKNLTTTNTTKMKMELTGGNLEEKMESITQKNIPDYNIENDAQTLKMVATENVLKFTEENNIIQNQESLQKKNNSEVLFQPINSELTTFQNDKTNKI